ncbi:MAG: hypothetical protein OHK0015_42880 [Chloroflexi bacterium OHK40]
MKDSRTTLVALGPEPAKVRPLLTYAEACALLAINFRTLSRRIAAGRYRTYGEGNGKRILYSSILDDIRRECGEVL